MTYSNVFDAWRKSADNIWLDYINHAFVRKLGDGTLPRECFLHYLKQDYIFLIHFTRSWALSVTKSETVDEMRLAARTANALINEEIDLHVSTCAAAGISEQELLNTQERTENLAYTRYVLDAGHSGDMLDLLAALAPCVLGYGEIGLELAQHSSSNAYSNWIKVYSGEEYQRVCQDVGKLIDDAVERRIGAHPSKSPRWQGLTDRFVTATRLEIGFWEMGLVV